MATSTNDRSLRADARRNRDAMLAAARVVFAREGLDAPLELVAREAGVARATQHRHFPTRDALVQAIFEDNLAELQRVAAAPRDPADVYVALVRTLAGMLVRDRGFVDLFRRNGVCDEIRQDVSRRFLLVLEQPLSAAQAAGRVRADLRLDDATLIVDMLSGAAVTGPNRPPDRMARAVMLVLDAIEPQTPEDG